MLNLLFNEDTLYEKPYFTIAYGVFAVTMSMALSLIIFKEISSFPIIFFSAIAVAPILINFIDRDEDKHEETFTRYKKSMTVFGMIFFSMALAFALWFAFLPEELVKTVFEFQLRKVPIASGNFAFDMPLFWKILLNNIGLLLAFFVLSLFYGYGSILLLVWNSSILGLIWGNALRVFVHLSDTTLIVEKMIYIIPYLIPEVVAYFLAAIGGGILYINLTKHKNEDALNDSLKFLGVAIGMIIIGAIIETIILRLI